MTANNDNDLRTSRSAELVESLRRTIAETVAGEEALLRSVRTTRHADSKKHEEEQKRLEEQIAKANEANDAGFMRRWDQLRRHFENRHVRLEQGAQTRRRDLPRLVEEARGGFLGQLQQRKLKLDKERQAVVAAVEKETGEALVILDAQGEELEALYDRAWKTCAGAPGLRYWLKRSRTEAAARAGEEVRDPTPHLEEAARRMTQLENKPLMRLMGKAPGLLPSVAVAVAGAGVILATRMDFRSGELITAVAGVGEVVAILVVLAQLISLALAWPTAKPLFAALAAARSACLGSRRAQERKLQNTTARLKEQHDTAAAAVQAEWGDVEAVSERFANAQLDRLRVRLPKLLRRLDDQLNKRRRHLEFEHTTASNALQVTNQTKLDAFHTHWNTALATFEADTEMRWNALERAWKSRAGELHADATGRIADAAARFPAWETVDAAAWTAASSFPSAVKFGELRAEFARATPAQPKTPSLAEACPDVWTMPLTLTFPAEGSLFLDTAEAGDAGATAAFNNIMLRTLLVTPPGKAAFTIIDPIGLGQNFAGLMNLADYEESLINHRIWTQREQIDQRLDELSDHIEKVIQMYLRNEYATITDYNAQAGTVAEKYLFLVVADFPANFSDHAIKRLQSIIASGPRCGVFTLLHMDRRMQGPGEFVLDEFRRNAITLRRENGAYTLVGGPSGEGITVTLDAPPTAEVELPLVQRIGHASIDSNRVEVPFSQIAPPPGEVWAGDTTHELRVPIGRSGATKQQIMAIGKGTRQHALFAGKTGSGKSTLFHVIITNLALHCSPDQVEFYLIDFKKGVEFKCYATKRLPHAKVVAIESDREFAMSVLQRVDDELKRRGDMFRKLGVQDIAGYKRAGGTEPVPRTLLMIDEFQEFFVQDDTVAQTASLLLDRIVRQGRAFGIHVLLGSQTLGGAYSLARTTIGQMVIRVALQCNEADAYLIMDDSNSAPRLLSRPGEGIYNDAAGAMEGNSPFQVVWLPDAERDERLQGLRERADRENPDWRGPIVFEGNAPADISENHQLLAALASTPVGAPSLGRAWLGAPNSIKGPTEAVFRRQSGNHLLIVGQREEATLTMLGLALLSLGAQYGPGAAKFILLHSAAPGSTEDEFLQRVTAAIPHEVEQPRPHEVPDLVRRLAVDMHARSTGEVNLHDAPSVFVLIHGVHKYKKLRHEDDFSFSMGDEGDAPKPAADFTSLLTEGSSLGIHLLASLDTFNNVNRWMNRKALSEFEMRVVFQMSANDSASLIDSPRASDLGLHRALYHNEHEGTLETFRPYSMPASSFFPEAAAV